MEFCQKSFGSKRKKNDSESSFSVSAWTANDSCSSDSGGFVLQRRHYVFALSVPASVTCHQYFFQFARN